LSKNVPYSWSIRCKNKKAFTKKQTEKLGQKGKGLMNTGKVFWDYFCVTGNIGAYLLFKEISRKNNYLPCGSLNSARKGRKLG